MPFLSLTSRLLLLSLLGAGGGVLSAQSASPASGQDQAPPSKGKVLFERHDPAPDSTPDTPDTASADSSSQNSTATKTGSSSSLKRSRTTLRRRAATNATAAAGEPVAEDPVELPRANSSNEIGRAVSSSIVPDESVSQVPTVPTAEDAAAARRVPDRERSSVELTGRDLDLHLNSHTGLAEIRAQLLVRNAGPQPLQEVPLRISGALRWESVRAGGVAGALPVQQHLLPDDLDHTGTANEVVVELPTPLPPGQSVSLDLYYGGRLTASAQRLLAMGAPAGRAALTDWDTVTDTFTGLRGLGSVLWYPVSGQPALLREGDAVTRAVESSRTRDAGSRFHLRLALEYSGSRPDAAFFCGERQGFEPAKPEGSGDSGFVTAEWTLDPLGSHTPSLFVAGGAPQEAAGGLLRVVTDRADTAAAAGEAAARIRPMLAEWLGAAPRSSLDIIDLPIPGASGFADGSLLVAPLTTAPAAVLAPSLVQPLAAAWLPVNIASPWLHDGIPAFLQAVWIERTAGRDAALAGLAASFTALRAQAAPSPGFSSSQPVDTAVPAGPPLTTCADPLCARTRAAYVFEMLRGMLGDSALQQAISGWAVEESRSGMRSPAEEAAQMERLLQQVAGTRNLTWFFRDWIDADHGLPELTIVTVAPRRVERSSPTNYLPEARKPVAGPIGAEPVAPTDPRDMSERDQAALAAADGGAMGPAPGSWLVAVEVQNNGSADAEVPVTVRSGGLTNTLPLHIAGHSRATIRVPFEAEPQEVTVNDGSVPEVRTSTHRRSIGSLPVAR